MNGNKVIEYARKFLGQVLQHSQTGTTVQSHIEGGLGVQSLCRTYSLI